MQADDYNAIQTLIHSYAYRLDGGDLEGLGMLFAHADFYSSADSEEPIRSDPKAVAELFRSFLHIYPDGTPRTRHMMANIIIEPEGADRARAKAYVMVFQQTDELPLQAIIGGGYDDQFAKVDGRWRFVRRRLMNDLFGNLGAHGKYPFGPQVPLLAIQPR